MTVDLKTINDQIGSINAISGSFALIAEFIVGPGYDIWGRKMILLVAFVFATIG